VLAADKEQAGVILDYVKALFGHPLVGAVKALFGRPSLAPLVARRLRDAVELKTGISIEVHASSYKGVRGYTVVGAVLDEVAFWPTDETANPDSEVLAALRPAMATVPGALLLAISTPYGRRGELHRAFERHYGRPESDVLVWRAPSTTMNPTLSAAFVARQYEDDPVAAAAGAGAGFR